MLNRGPAALFGSIVLLFVAGCSTWPKDMPAEVRATELSIGYAALLELLGDEQSVNKLLVIKSVGASTERVIDEISAVSGEALEDLEQLGVPGAEDDVDPGAALPVVERAARDAIEGQTARELLLSGDTFEVRLLLSQAQALRYGHFLAIELAVRDSNEKRRDRLTQLGESYEQLHAQVFELLDVAE